MMISMTVFDPVIEQKQTTIAKDLRINLQRLLNEGALDAEDAHFALLSLSSTAEYPAAVEYAKSNLQNLGVPSEQIQEASESSAIMAMLNTYYKFKYMIGKDEDYQSAGLRMTSLARPALGKLRFEKLAFAISVLNGCQSCIRSHEEVLRREGVPTDQIHDLARLASVVKALKTLNACT